MHGTNRVRIPVTDGAVLVYNAHMKSAFFLPFVLLLGLVIGGWAPKEELRSARKELDVLNAKLSDRDKSQRFDAFTRIVQIPDRAKQPKPQAARPSPAHAYETNAAARPAAAAEAPTNTVSKKADPKKEAPPKPEDLRARIDEAKELWKTRVDIARAQWIDRLKLTPDGTAQFDNAINTMNENLYAAMQNLADAVGSADTLTPEAGLRSFNEMTSVLVQTYDTLDAVIPDAQQAEAAKMELTDFIDPAIAEPLVAVQDKLENLPPERRPGMRFHR